MKTPPSPIYIVRNPGISMMAVWMMMMACSEKKQGGSSPPIDSSSTPHIVAHTDSAAVRRNDIHDEPSAVKWEIFHGGNFDVRYPSSFTTEKVGEPDGISFVSPDKLVRFYVFSPLWNGTSTVYHMDRATEVLKQQSTERVGSRRITRVTYQRTDDHSMRSFEDVEDTLYNTRRIFGIFYATPKAYTDYKDLYLKFKASLKQYADA